MNRGGVGVRRTALVDVLGLTAIGLALFDYLRPSLLLLDTFPAGGDMACHYPTFQFFRDYLLPRGRLHGWYAGAYLGQPLLLYYFPLPFAVMAALSAAVSPTAAFKIGSALGVFLLPLCAYFCFRLLGFRSPGPLVGATAAYAFLLVEDNPIWGGTLASTLAGEFAYTYGTGAALVFLGLAYRSYSRGDGPGKPALVLALTALAHGYAVLWAGLATMFFLYASRQAARTLFWLLSVAALAAGVAAFWLLPLLSGWRWTTPFNDAWISVGWKNLLPPALWPAFAMALVGLGLMPLAGRSRGGSDRRVLYLWHAALVAVALAGAGPALGIIDVRFVPFAQLAVALAGAAVLAWLLASLRSAPLAAIGLLAWTIAHSDSHSSVSRYWAEYDYSGAPAKELWPAWRALNERIRADGGAGRVAVEYSAEHERAGSIRIYETLPYFSGRPTLEGVYNQASLNTHEVYYLASELGERSPNPFRSVEFAHFDTDAALRHLRLLAADHVVALSDKLQRALDARPDVELVARVHPYALYRLKQPARYVEPLACAPVRSSEVDWRAKAMRWFARRPLPCAPLAFTEDPRVTSVETDEWLPPPELPLDTAGVDVKETLGPEEIQIETSRIGHPLLVKASWHPRWRASGADGPYRVSPALMMVVPRQQRVELRYGPDWSDFVGRALTLASLAGIVLLRLAARRAPALAPSARLPLRLRLLLFAESAPTRRWGGVVPLALLALLLAGRFRGDAPAAHARVAAEQLARRAEAALAAGRYADAAEYARHAVAGTLDKESRASLLALHGEALLAAGRAAEARDAFASALQEAPVGSTQLRARRGLLAAERRLSLPAP